MKPEVLELFPDFQRFQLEISSRKQKTKRIYRKKRKNKENGSGRRRESAIGGETQTARSYGVVYGVGWFGTQNWLIMTAVVVKKPMELLSKVELISVISCNTWSWVRWLYDKMIKDLIAKEKILFKVFWFVYWEEKCKENAKKSKKMQKNFFFQIFRFFRWKKNLKIDSFFMKKNAKKSKKMISTDISFPKRLQSLWCAHRPKLPYQCTVGHWNRVLAGIIDFLIRRWNFLSYHKPHIDWKSWQRTGTTPS